MLPFEDIHTIRLRGPWEYEVAGKSGRVNLPATREFLAGLSVSQNVVWRRGFGLPTGLESNQVHLVIAPSVASGTVWVNGSHLGLLDAANETRFDISSMLQLRNQLVLETRPVENADAPGMPFGEVHLEIVEP